MSFNNLGLSQEILDGLLAMRFETPTPIQEQCIPVALAGRDIVASAQTGTGKTAAFVIPILEMVKGPVNPGSIRALILTPTRELALQIDEQIFAIGYHSGVTSVTVYGGGDWGKQEKALKEGVHIVVATPGRLIDHMRIKDLDFSGLKFLVLDEADRMLDMGFMPAMQTILGRIPKKRQSLLFSATISPRVEKLCEDIVVDPVRVNIATQTTAVGVSQYWYEISYRSKIPLIEKLMEEEQWDSTIIFAGTKRDTAELARALENRGMPVVAIHGDREQAEREQALHEFRTGKVKVIVATDVMARGIDIDGVSHVINFDVPRDTDDYIHRIGRTARANTTGVAITFCSSRDRQNMQQLLDVQGERLVKKPLPEGFAQEADAEGGRPVKHRHDRHEKPRTNRPVREGEQPAVVSSEPMEARPPREPRPPRESRPPRDNRELREGGPAREPREPREGGPAREPRELREGRPQGERRDDRRTDDRRGPGGDRRKGPRPDGTAPRQPGRGPAKEAVPSGPRTPRAPATHLHKKDSKKGGLLSKIVSFFTGGKKK